MPRWEQVPLRAQRRLRIDPRVYDFFAPSSGRLIARMVDGADYSDDAGDTWHGLGLHRETVLKAVDPVDHNLFYYETIAGLHKSQITGWMSHSGILSTREAIFWVGVSPADQNRLYVASQSRIVGASDRWTRRLRRSRDGGWRWDVVDELPEPLKYASDPGLLLLHPSHPDHLFYRAAGARSDEPGTPPEPLRESRDGGATWAPVLGSLRPVDGLAGGDGVAPERLFAFGLVVLAEPSRDPVSSILRSDDDGASWSEVAQFSDARVTNLLTDPDRPDHVWMSLAGPSNRVYESTDGGVSWTRLGEAGPGPVSSLVRGADGRYLYASGSDGLWRLRLAPGSLSLGR